MQEQIKIENILINRIVHVALMHRTKNEIKGNRIMIMVLLHCLEEHYYEDSHI